MMQSQGVEAPKNTPPAPMGMGDVLRVPVMRRLWYAQIVSVFGDFVALFAVITVMTFQMHATPQQITGVQIAYMLPIAVLGILSGVFVDRWPVKATMVSSDFLRAGLVLLLLTVHTPWGFYLVLAAISVVSSFFGPAQGVVIRGVVPAHGLRSANALMMQVMFVMRVIGGPTAAALVAWLGAKSCYAIDALSFVASGVFLATLALRLPPHQAAAAQGEGEPKTGMARVWQDMRQGLVFIFTHAGLVFVMAAMAAAMFVMGCFGPLIAIYVRDTLHASTKTFGVASGMIGIGLLLGINLLNAKAKGVRNALLIYSGLGGVTLGTFLLAAFPLLPVALLGLFGIGFSVSAIMVPSQTTIQTETPPAMLGRVGSTVMSMIFASQISGLLLSGVLASHESVRRVFALCGVLLLVLMVCGKLFLTPEAEGAAAAS